MRSTFENRPQGIRGSCYMAPSRVHNEPEKTRDGDGRHPALTPRATTIDHAARGAIAETTALIRSLQRAGHRQRLQGVAELRGELEELECTFVADALCDGWSWTDVGDALGVTKQAAHARHRRSPVVRLAVATRREEEPPSTPAATVLRVAGEEAAAAGSAAVDGSHILLGILRCDGGRASEVLRAHGVSLRRMRTELSGVANRRPGQSDEDGGAVKLPLAPDTRASLERAIRTSARRGDRTLDLEHLLRELLSDDGSSASRALATLGVSIVAVRADLSH